MSNKYCVWMCLLRQEALSPWREILRDHLRGRCIQNLVRFPGRWQLLSLCSDPLRKDTHVDGDSLVSLRPTFRTPKWDLSHLSYLSIVRPVFLSFSLSIYVSILPPSTLPAAPYSSKQRAKTQAEQEQAVVKIPDKIHHGKKKGIKQQDNHPKKNREQEQEQQQPPRPQKTRAHNSWYSNAVT